MEPTYYTPNAEEIHPDFEFEYKKNSEPELGWRKEIFPTYGRVEDLYELSEIRVKHLDLDDMNDEGFDLYRHDENHYYLRKGVNTWLYYVRGDSGPWIKMVVGLVYDTGIPLYAGHCLNISEFRRILKRIGQDK